MYRLRVPASRVGYVPEAQGGLPPGPHVRYWERAPASAVSTAYRGTPGSQTPRGKTTSIAFRTVQRVGVHTDEPTVLFLDCATRQYFFRFPSATLCETCAGRIAVAAAQAGDAQRSDRGT